MQSILLLAFLVGVNGVQFHVKNRAGGPIWVGILGNPGHPHLENGGFSLNMNDERTFNAPDNWAGRIWPRSWCDPNSKHCLTGDCGNRIQCQGAGGAPPATLFEIKLKGDRGQDFYDISLVDGFNLPASVTPIGGTGNRCRAISCARDLNNGCPRDLQLIGYTGAIVGCKSSCLRFNTDQYCCRGSFNNPQVCNPNSWPVNSAGYFKQGCPDAYSYAYDDATSTFTCTNAREYRITFG